MKIALGLYLGTVLFYALYLAYCTLWVMKGNGRLAQLPVVVRAHCWFILYFVLILDILFNFTVGTVVFVELPEIRNATFTARCKKWLTAPPRPYRTKLVHWRYTVAEWVCNSWLNPAQPGHC